MSSLQVQNLSKSFGRTKALSDLNFTVEDGEFMVMLGPTAAGKTTTLRCVAGLERLDHGLVKLDNQMINQLSPAERDIAFVFQTYALYPRKTAFQNMAFPLKAQNWSKHDIETRIQAVAQQLRISELLERRPANMSGGQQQRVALGRAMVREPRIFLMDEPLTNLDFKLRVEMRAELKRLQKELGTTFFYVTNDQVEAMSMADRIIVLSKGVIQQIDTPEAIYDHPANLFVAKFVGNPRMNILACNFDATTRQLCGQKWQLSLRDHQIQALSSKTKGLILGVRSEDIQLYTTPTENAIAGTIFVLEPLGDRTIVDVRVGDETIKVRADADFNIDEGQTVWLDFDPDRIHIFDQDTEHLIF